MSNVSTNVSFGKPKVTGAVYVAPAGSTLPTDATTALDAAFLSLGYISEDGLVNTINTDTETINAWGGDKVLVGQTKFGEIFKVMALETNANALKTFYGAANVTVVGSAITITANSAPLPQVEVVFEIVMTGGRVKRIVVPIAQIVDRSGDITYTDGDAIEYPLVFEALPDSSGNTHKEYIAVVTS